MNRMPSHLHGVVLAALRIYTGLFWLTRGMAKFALVMPTNRHANLKLALTWAANHSVGVLHSFTLNVLLPNLDALATFERFAEVFVGVFLILGLLSRVAGLVATLLAAGALMAFGQGAQLAIWSSLAATAFALSLVNVLLPTGRYLGIDALLAQTRRPPVPARVAVTTAPLVEAHIVEEHPLDAPSAPAE